MARAMTGSGLLELFGFAEASLLPQAITYAFGLEPPPKLDAGTAGRLIHFLVNFPNDWRPRLIYLDNAAAV